MFTSTKVKEVLFEVKNNVGIIILNRPEVMNVLNESMVTSIYSKLKEWENKLSFVILKGTDGKVFCAGGDARSIIKDTQAGISFFRNEYKMNYLIGTYKKPFISICDGAVIGGGVGMCVHATYRIATEKTLFATPETTFGGFPDVGGSYFLPRLPKKLGLFLGLTGYKLQGIDTVKAGIATHFVPSNKVPDLINKLVDSKVELIEDVLFKNTLDVADKDFSLTPYLDLIESCFSGQSVEHIQELLEEEGSPWSRNILKILSKASPTALKLAKMVLDRGASQDLRNCFITEFRVGRALMERVISSDLYEGIKALFIEKNKNIKWNPASLKDVNENDIEKCFAPLPPGEELDI